MFGFIIDHMLGMLPAWLWPAVAGGAFAVYLLAGILSHIPAARLYGRLIKPVSFVVLLVAVFLYGGAGVTAILQAQIKEAEGRIAVAEQASKDVNDRLADALKNKKEVIKERVLIVKQAIEVHRDQINADCRLVDEAARKYYNQGVKNKPEDTK